MSVQPLKSWIALFIAINLTGIGVALFVQANLGSDTITVFIDGFKNVVGLSLGGASRIYNFIALLLALILSRKDIGWCTIVYALSVGYAMDFYNAMIMDLNIMQLDMILRFLTVILGQLCLGLTFALLITFCKGMCQSDAICYGIVRHIELPYMIIRTGLDFILLALGWIMGGVVGVGSIIAVATTGYIVNLILNLFNKYKKVVIS